VALSLWMWSLWHSTGCRASRLCGLFSRSLDSSYKSNILTSKDTSRLFTFNCSTGFLNSPSNYSRARPKRARLHHSFGTDEDKMPAELLRTGCLVTIPESLITETYEFCLVYLECHVIKSECIKHTLVYLTSNSQSGVGTTIGNALSSSKVSISLVASAKPHIKCGCWSRASFIQ